MEGLPYCSVAVGTQHCEGWGLSWLMGAVTNDMPNLHDGQKTQMTLILYDNHHVCTHQLRADGGMMEVCKLVK